MEAPSSARPIVVVSTGAVKATYSPSRSRTHLLLSIGIRLFYELQRSEAAQCLMGPHGVVAVLTGEECGASAGYIQVVVIALPELLGVGAGWLVPRSR